MPAAATWLVKPTPYATPLVPGLLVWKHGRLEGDYFSNIGVDVYVVLS